MIVGGKHKPPIRRVCSVDELKPGLSHHTVGQRRRIDRQFFVQHDRDDVGHEGAQRHL